MHTGICVYRRETAFVVLHWVHNSVRFFIGLLSTFHLDSIAVQHSLCDVKGHGSDCLVRSDHGQPNDRSAVYLYGTMSSMSCPVPLP